MNAAAQCRESPARPDTVVDELLEHGWSLQRGVLSAADCEDLIAGYDDPARYRSRVVMERHSFGRGEYQYFDNPLPDRVAALRADFYPALVPVANEWQARMGLEPRFPATHHEFLRECHAAGQDRPTPLILRYTRGGYNCLHQDLYGDLWFPLQLAVLLSQPGRDFDGGEFVMTEQRPRRQSVPHVVPLTQGDAVIFAVNQRPVAGRRGYHRVTMRHGVSALRSGERFALGIIFHDAR